MTSSQWNHFGYRPTGIRTDAQTKTLPAWTLNQTDTSQKKLSIIKSLLFIIDSHASLTHSDPKALRGNDGRNRVETGTTRHGSPDAAESHLHRGTNQSGMRDHNERLVLSLVRQHGSLAK